MGEQLRDRGLPDPRLADQDGIVLGTPGEDLDHALELRRAPDHRVDLPSASSGRKLGPKLIDGGRAAGLAGATGSRGLRRGLAEDARCLGAHALEVDAEALENAGGNALTLAYEAEEEMLGSDIGVVEASRLVHGKLDDLLRARSKTDLAEDRAVAAADDELDRRADLVEFDAEIGEHLGGDAVALTHEAKQDVLGPDVVVVEAVRFLLGQRKHAASALRELVKSIGHGLPLSCSPATATGRRSRQMLSPPPLRTRRRPRGCSHRLTPPL